MGSFVGSKAFPIPLRILFVLQGLLVIPAVPLAFFSALFGPFVFPKIPALAIIILPWVFSALGKAYFLMKERETGYQGKVTQLYYIRMQNWKLIWTSICYLPVAIIFIATAWMKLLVIVIFIQLDPIFITFGVLWALDWFLTITGVVYASCCFRGQTEGTIRLTTESPINLGESDEEGQGEETTNDEEIARTLQSMEPEWSA